jgi:hypothetical protein
LWPLLPSCKNRPKPETLELGPRIITLVCDPTHVERIWWNGILVKEIRPLGMGIWVLGLFLLFLSTWNKHLDEMTSLQLLTYWLSPIPRWGGPLRDFLFPICDEQGAKWEKVWAYMLTRFWQPYLA